MEKRVTRHLAAACQLQKQPVSFAGTSGLNKAQSLVHLCRSSPAWRRSRKEQPPGLAALVQRLQRLTDVKEYFAQYKMAAGHSLMVAYPLEILQIGKLHPVKVVHLPWRPQAHQRRTAPDAPVIILVSYAVNQPYGRPEQTVGQSRHHPVVFVNGIPIQRAPTHGLVAGILPTDTIQPAHQHALSRRRTTAALFKHIYD